MADNPHKGHRERVKNEFRLHGMDKDTPPHKVLELLLFYCVKQCDTNPLAHQLIDRFGSLSGVLDAPMEQLIKFPGLTLNSAVLLKLIMPVARIYNYEKEEAKKNIFDIETAEDYILVNYDGFTEEKLALLSLDSNFKKLSLDFVAEGDIASVGVSTRDIITTALNTGARKIIMAHNHPSGNALPSPQDIYLTKLVKSALSVINVQLEDHIIIAGGEYVSLIQSKDYSYIFEEL